jgi:hypothetical protein
MAIPAAKLQQQQFRGRKLDRDIERPQCPSHPGSRVVADGWYSTWSDAYRRARYRCRRFPGDKGHFPTSPSRVRHPTAHHPHHGEACPTCDHQYRRFEGPRTGDQFIYTFHEVADVLIAVGRLDSLRSASGAVRNSALRYMNPPDPARLNLLARTWVDETPSSEAHLASNYVDVFAPILLDKWLPTQWPKAIAVDSMPLKTVGARRHLKTKILQLVGDMPAGEILIAYDQTVIPARPIAITVAGGRSAAQFRAFFGSLGGQPAWVTADQDMAIELAVSQQWPGTILYHSRAHIRRLFEDALDADGIPRMVRTASPEEAAAARRRAWPANQVKEFSVHPVWAALRGCQRSAKEWDKLKALVEQHVPKRRQNIRAKLLEYENKVIEQIVLADANPGMPVGTGAVEGNLAERIKRLQNRAGRWQNQRRLDKVLKLCVLDLRGHASRDAYAALIRQHFEAQANRSGADWKRHLDRGGGSLPKAVYDAMQEAKREEAAARRIAKVGQTQRRVARANARHAAAGRPPAHTGTRRAKGGGRKGYRRVGGMVLTDFPELMAEWHPTRNAGQDPSKIRAGSKSIRVWWQHQGPAPHEGHLHEWDTVPSDRAGKQSRCPYCENVKVCDGNSLAKRDPDVAREWHPIKNGDRTPDDVIVGAREYAWWKCERRGHVYRARVFSRTKGITGCQKCLREELAQLTRDAQKALKAERQRLRAQTLRVIHPPDDEIF